MAKVPLIWSFRGPDIDDLPLAARAEASIPLSSDVTWHIMERAYGPRQALTAWSATA